MLEHSPPPGPTLNPSQNHLHFEVANKYDNREDDPDPAENPRALLRRNALWVRTGLSALLLCSSFVLFICLY